MTVTRRRFLEAAGGSAATLAGAMMPLHRAAAATTYRFKYGSTLPSSHPANVSMRQAAERIRKESHGRLDIQVFADSALGGDSDMLSQVRAGGLECMTIAGLILSTVVPMASINGMGFAFHDYASVWKAMDGDLGALIRSGIKKVNIIPLDRVWDNGFREITTSTQTINAPKDLAGLKIRVPVSPLYTSLFQKLGAAPTGVSLQEVYSDLQTHLVDGQENPLAVVESAKLYEVQKHCAMTNHVWDGLWVLFSPRAWNRLPPDLQKLASDVLNETALQQRKATADLNGNLKTVLAGKGMQFTTPDPAPFREKLAKAGFYKEWQARFGNEAWQVLEKYTGTLA
jgi:tripartite ATP-independent transporter DctP family solute receptor